MLRALLAARACARPAGVVHAHADHGDHAVPTATARWRPSTRGRARRAAELAAVEPRAVVLVARPLDLAPAGARGYATLRRRSTRARFAGRDLPRDLERARARCSSTRARRCCSPARQTAETAAARLGAERRRSSIVTLGPDGAIARRRRRARARARLRDGGGRHHRRRRPLRRRLRVGRPLGSRRSSCACAGRSCTRSLSVRVATAVAAGGDAGARSWRRALDTGCRRQCDSRQQR